MLLEQRATLAFGHTAPYPELDPVIQGVGAALRDHRAMPTDDRGLALSGSTNEKLIRIGRTA